MIKYFAYGMNTNIYEMETRCPGAKNLGHHVLMNHRLRFAVHADVVPAPYEEVHGVLWELTDEHLKSLDALEGFPYYYDRKEVEVCSPDCFFGEHKDVVVYFMQPGNKDSMPSESYLDCVMLGYLENRVPLLQIVDALKVVKKQQELLQKSNTFLG